MCASVSVALASLKMLVLRLWYSLAALPSHQVASRKTVSQAAEVDVEPLMAPLSLPAP